MLPIMVGSNASWRPMFFLAKLVEPFLLPPALITIGLVACAVLLYLRPKSRLVRLALVGVVTTSYLLSTWPVANGLVATLESDYWSAVTPADAQGVQAIIVLAGGVSEAGPRRPYPELYGDTWVRLRRGLEVFDQFRGALPLIYSGVLIDPLHQNSGSSEPGLVSAALSRWGIGPDRGWMEATSRNTYESGVASARLLREHFPAVKRLRILLVTSAWHMRRARSVFDKLAVDTVPVPCDFRSGPTDITVVAMVPNYAAFSTSTVMIREWLGILSYWVRRYL